MDYEALAKKYGGSPAEVKGRPDDIDALAKQFGGKLTSSAEPESRNLFYVANDTVIAIANAAASGVKAAADFVSPGNSFSKAIDEFVKKGEESQSDIVKAAKEKYAQDMEEAKGFMEEVSATGKYLAGSPLQAAGMALGSFAGPGLAIKGATKGAQLLNASEKVASRLGLGTGVVTGAAMSGGDAAGSAYEMVMQTPDDILMQNDLIKSQVEAGRSLEEIKQEAATTAARRASIVPALIGGVSGAFGVERILAGLGGKEAAKSLSAAAIKSGLTEAIQEGIEEGATEYSARAAAQTYDPRIDPMKGVAGAATMGAALGAIPGAAIGALDASRRIQADELQKSIEAARAAYEQETAAAETAAQEQAAKITQTAVPDETGKVAPSSFDISALDLAGVPVPETTTTEQKPDVVPAKQKDETAEQKIIRYKAELAVGEDASGKKITPSHRKSIEASLAKLEEKIRAEQLTGTITGAGEPSAEGVARELGTAAGKPVTSVSTGVEPTGGAPKLSVSGEGAQRPSLEEQYRSLPTEELITIYGDFLGDPSESQAAKAELIRRGEYAPIRIAELEEVLKNPNIESERRVRLETELNELKGGQGAEPTPIEPAVTEPATDLGQPVVEAKEEPTEEPAAEAVSAAPTEVTEEQAPVEITPDIEQTAQQLYNDYVTQQLEAGVPSMLPWEQISQTTKQPFYDAALAATKPSAGEQVFARMAEDISKTTEKTAKEEKVTEEKKAEPVKKAAPAKKETKAQREVREAEEEIKKLETTEKKKPAVKMREEKVKVALKSGSGFQVASAIAAGYDPKKSLTVDNITQVFAQRLAKLMSAFDHEPEIVVGKVEGNRPGKYDPETETITIDPSAPRNVPLESVILHELTHYAADRMIDNYDKLTPEQKQNIKELDKLHKYVQSFLGEKYEIPTLKEFVAEAFSNTKFQQDMAALPPMKTKNLLTAFAERILMMLGFRDRAYNTLGDVVSNVDQLIFGPRRGESKEISYAPKAVGPVTDRSFDEMVDEMKSDKPIAFSTKAKEIAMTGKGREALVRVLQNDRIANERWQDRLMAQGRIIGYGSGFNNIYDQITLASGNADYVYKQYVQNIAQDIYDNVTDYANEYGVSTDRALKELGQFAIAKHYDERRKILYLKTVPLSDAKIIPYKGQVNLSPAEVRTEIFKKLDEDEKLSEADIKALRSLLDKIVFDPSQKFLDNKNPDLLNITNTKYDVAGAYTDSEIATIMREYEARRPAVDKVLNKIKQLNKVNIDLNRQANYMSKFADNWIDFYGWENYIPLKGKGLSEEAQLLDLDSRKLGGELQEAQHSMEGRITPPDNPILQVMSDGALAALRVGRKNVTQAIYNAVDQELIAGDKKTISFAERNNIKKLEEYRGESTIFHYMPDGNVAVIKLKDKAQREAIRRTYRETSPLIDKANLITGFFGQLHTRYNVSFAPLNFVRDVLTNAFTLGADLGPTKTFEYIGAVAAGVVRQQYKAAKFSWLYSNGKIDEIRALAMKDKSGYFRDMLEYVKTGGKVSYIAGIAPKGQYSEFMKASGGGKILTTKRQIDKFFDMWIDSFELTARVAAYRISKSTEKARLVSEGVSEADAEQGAKVAGAAYAKNLANFEQVGEWGKALGAFYMFFRPSATGAVRAIKAISPAFMDVKDAKTRLPEYAEMLNLRQQLKTEKVEGKKKEKMEARLAELEKAVSKFESTYAEKKKHARVMAASLIGMGYMIYLMSKSMADDDDLGRNKVSTDDMARWTRNARFFIPGSDIIIQIPWGFGLGAFAAFGAQLASLGDANTDFSDTVANMATVALDSFIPVPASRISAIDHPLQFTLDSIMPSVARPLLELGMNMDALGRQIYNNRQSRFGEAYTGGDNIPEIYKNAARYWFDETGMDVGPGVLYFLANNYADGVSRLVQNTYNSALWMQGDKDFNAKTDMLIFDGFIGSKSNFDARQWQKVEDDLKDRQKIVNMLKDNKPDRYAEYLAAHPLDQMLVDMYNQDVNGYLRDLRAQANKFRAMEGLSPKDRKDIVDSIVLQQNLEKFRLVQLYKAMGVEP